MDVLEIRNQRAKSKITDKNAKNDLQKRSYFFALELIRLVDSLPKQRSSWVIGDQLLRSGTSIGANITEAQAASSRRDFINFLQHALKSANETKFWLGLLRDSGIAKNEKVSHLLQEAHEHANILGASIITLKGKRKL